MYVAPLKKAICSLAVGSHRRLLDLSAPSFEDYAQRHGYDLILATRSLCHERPVSWSKVLLVRELIDRYDLVLWVDADATFADTTADIADDLTPDCFLWMVEHAYNGGRQPCAGVLAAYSGEETSEFLDEVWGCEDLVEHPWWEQAAIMRLIGYDISLPGQGRFIHQTRWTSRVGMLGTEWNSMRPDPHPEPRIVHLAGMSNRERMPLTAGYAERFALERTLGTPVSSVDSKTKHSRPGISVILPVLPGRLERWMAALEAIGMSGLLDDDELVVVDSASGLGGLLASVYGATVRYLPGGYGLTDAWEVGCDTARHDLVALLAGSVRPRLGWLDALYAALDAGADVARAYWSDEILPPEHDLSILPPGFYDLLGAERCIPALAMRRVNALSVLRVDDGLESDDISLARSLARSGISLRRAAGSYVDRPLAEHGWTRSLTLRADAPLAAPWYRWNYSDPASRVPFSKELPFFLNARGLDGIGVVVSGGRGRFVSHLLAHWRCRRLVVVDGDDGSPEHLLDVAELTARVAVFDQRVEIVEDASPDPFERFAAGSLDFVCLGSADPSGTVRGIGEWVRRLTPEGMIGVVVDATSSGHHLEQSTDASQSILIEIFGRLGLHAYGIPGEGGSTLVIATNSTHVGTVPERQAGHVLATSDMSTRVDDPKGSYARPISVTLDAGRIGLIPVVESFLEAAGGCGQEATDRLRLLLEEVPAYAPEAAWLSNRILEAETAKYEKEMGALRYREAAVREELAAVYASTSWRVSAPIRWLRNHTFPRHNTSRMPT